ncbi:MAG: putative toxin-antitoxin system toxin component, PIN family [Bacteroidales bacterium]|nr:putative toxin-antitoxin system toxin component, PIN family [Clostridium sp.]MCM1202982.1 putative toxin-antitoxin system toxin component, PIN family [Bacteroidales bacterium]
MQVVIDTNIIVSALLNPNGVCYLFLDRVLAGVYDVVVSEAIMSEYDDVLRRPQFGFDDEDINYLMDWFFTNALMVEVNEKDYLEGNMVDEKDIPFYVTARATKSRLVTGNIKHYPVEEMRTMIWELS